MNACCFIFFSITAGLVAATMGTPADVIKTRIMNNPTAYRGVIHCFITAVNNHLLKDATIISLTKIMKQKPLLSKLIFCLTG
jgi:hypothetical protein